MQIIIRKLFEIMSMKEYVRNEIENYLKFFITRTTPYIPLNLDIVKNSIGPIISIECYSFETQSNIAEKTPSYV